MDDFQNYCWFSQDFTIRPHEVDAKHYWLPRFMMWTLQEAAVNHVTHLKMGYNDLIKDNLAWALAGFKVKINKMPMWNEDIRVRTWGKSSTKLFIFREFEVTSKEYDYPLIVATSNWFIMDLNTRRPIRIEPYAGVVHNEELLDYPLKKSLLPDPLSFNGSDLSSTKKVCFEDLDHNFHANNVHYIRWMFDSLKDDFKMEHILKDYEIYFVHELSCGDQIESMAYELQEEGGKTFFHLLTHPQGGYSAMAKSVWQSRK